LTKKEEAGAVKRSNRVPWLAGVLTVLLIVAAAGVYAWRAFHSPCEADAVERTSAFLVTQMTRYDEVYVSATSGTRTSIDYPVTVLQQILMDTQAVDVPACMRTAKSELVNYMGDVIRAFQAFKAGEPDATVRDLLDDSYAHVRIFISELESVRKCAPYCLPY